jgi:demethylmenaquinone methyltransferase/2-methoxy-6-polyprenyl-1,4-benzoquinol methylase
MFDDIVDRYDLLNGFLSLGMDGWWRRTTARRVRVAPGDRVLDLGCGTGELGALLAGPARVVGVDVSGGMLRYAHRRFGTSLALVQGSAFGLPFADGSFRAAVSGFVLRNLDDLPAAFAELSRVVGPGGTVALVDATEPRSPAFRRLFDAYFGTVAPALGALVGKRDAYRYLARSLVQIPPPEEVCRLLGEAGFERASAKPLTGGAVTLFTAVRAAPAASGPAARQPGPGQRG